MAEFSGNCRGGIDIGSSKPPIEQALVFGDGAGYKAEEPGVQPIRRILLRLPETEVDRMQEYCLRWLPEHDDSFQEIVPQQCNFNP